MSLSHEKKTKVTLTASQLSAHDDIATEGLVDSITDWFEIPKIQTKERPTRGFPQDDIVTIIRKDVVENENPKQALKRLLQMKAFNRYHKHLDSRSRSGFEKHLRRYVDIYMPDCEFEVSATNRYRISKWEADLVARKRIKAGQSIKYLSGLQIRITEEEEADLMANRVDFSVTRSSRGNHHLLFLGPARFANHDCNANADITIGEQGEVYVKAKRRIEVGQSILVNYGSNYFGEDNCECLCATCEQMGKGPWKSDQTSDEQQALLPTDESPSLRQTRSGGRRQIELFSHATLLLKAKSLTKTRTAQTPETPQIDAVALQISNVNAQSQLTPAPTNDSRSLSPSALQTPSGLANKDGSHAALDSSAPLRYRLQPVPLATSSIGSSETPDADSSLVPAPIATITVTALHQIEEFRKVFTEGVVEFDTGEGIIQFRDSQYVKQSKEMRTDERLSRKSLLSSSSSGNMFEVPLILPTITDDGQPKTTRHKGDYVQDLPGIMGPEFREFPCKVDDCEMRPVQDASGRSAIKWACPRCERHFKLYGFQWPKTSPEDSGEDFRDDEERQDWRSYKRYLSPDEQEDALHELGVAMSGTRQNRKKTVPDLDPSGAMVDDCSDQPTKNKSSMAKSLKRSRREQNEPDVDDTVLNQTKSKRRKISDERENTGLGLSSAKRNRSHITGSSAKLPVRELPPRANRTKSDPENKYKSLLKIVRRNQEPLQSSKKAHATKISKSTTPQTSNRSSYATRSSGPASVSQDALLGTSSRSHPDANLHIDLIGYNGQKNIGRPVKILSKHNKGWKTVLLSDDENDEDMEDDEDVEDIEDAEEAADLGRVENVDDFEYEKDSEDVDDFEEEEDVEDVDDVEDEEDSEDVENREDIQNHEDDEEDDSDLLVNNTKMHSIRRLQSRSPASSNENEVGTTTHDKNLRRRSLSTSVGFGLTRLPPMECTDDNTSVSSVLSPPPPGRRTNHSFDHLYDNRSVSSVLSPPQPVTRTDHWFDDIGTDDEQIGDKPKTSEWKKRKPSFNSEDPRGHKRTRISTPPSDSVTTRHPWDINPRAFDVKAKPAVDSPPQQVSHKMPRNRPNFGSSVADGGSHARQVSSAFNRVRAACQVVKSKSSTFQERSQNNSIRMNTRTDTLPSPEQFNSVGSTPSTSAFGLGLDLLRRSTITNARHPSRRIGIKKEESEDESRFSLGKPHHPTVPHSCQLFGMQGCVRRHLG